MAALGRVLLQSAFMALYVGRAGFRFHLYGSTLGVIIFNYNDFLIGIGIPWLTFSVRSAGLSLLAHFFISVGSFKVVHEVQEQLIVLVDKQGITSGRHLHDLFHLVSGSLGHIYYFRVRCIVFGQLFDFSCVVVKLLIEHIPLQVDSELLHHALECDWEVMLMVLLLSAASSKMVPAHARHYLFQNDFVHDSSSLRG